MKLEEFLEKKGEGLKRLGAIFWTLNKVEMFIISNITFFFIDSSPGHRKNMVLNRALWDEKIFPSMENKRILFLRIISFLDEMAKEKSISFDKDRWMDICKSIQDAQTIRNDLAHNFLSFSDDGRLAFYTNPNQKGGPARLAIDLDKELKKADVISETLHESLDAFLKEFQEILRG